MYELRKGTELTETDREELMQVLEEMTVGNVVEIVTGDYITRTAEGFMVSSEEETPGIPYWEQEDLGPFTIEEVFATIVGR